jgi:ABC-type amino acid transport substrate-binding protein
MLRNGLLLFLLLPVLAFGSAKCQDLSYQTSQLQKIKASGVIRIATIRDNPPFYWQSHGLTRGYDYEVMQDIAKRLGVELQVITVPPGVAKPSVLDLVQKNQADLAVANLIINQQAAQQVYFTGPYLRESVVLAVNRKKIHTEGWELSAAYFSNKPIKIAVVKHSYQAILTKRLYPKAQMVYFPNFSQALAAVADGKVGIMPVEKQRIVYLLARQPSAVNQVAILKTAVENKVGLVTNYGSIRLHQWLDFYITIGNASKIGYLSKMRQVYFTLGGSHEGS